MPHEFVPTPLGQELGHSRGEQPEPVHCVQLIMLPDVSMASMK
jgi:hypothetical protein